MQIKGKALERPTANAARLKLRDRDLATAADFLGRYRHALLLDDPAREMVLQHEDVNAAGNRHLKYSQRYAGLPVWPCSLSVHLNAAGNIYPQKPA